RARWHAVCPESGSGAADRRSPSTIIAAHEPAARRGRCVEPRAPRSGMNTRTAARETLAPATRDFYHLALRALDAANVPFMVGGAYAFERYTGIERHTKDLDVFVRPPDARGALDALAEAGYHVELTYPHWLGKAFCSGDFVDVIFG